MQVVFCYLEENEQQCRFSIEELTDKMKACEYRPSVKTVKTLLLSKYKKDIVLSTMTIEIPVVCFTNTNHKSLVHVWYQQRCSSPQEERHRVTHTAMNTVMDGIRS